MVYHGFCTMMGINHIIPSGLKMICYTYRNMRFGENI